MIVNFARRFALSNQTQTAVSDARAMASSTPSLASALRVVFDADSKSLKRASSSLDDETTSDVARALNLLRAHARDDVDAVVDASLERASASRGARTVLVVLARERSSARALGEAVMKKLDASRDKRAALAACAGTSAIARGDGVRVEDVFDVKGVLVSLAAIAREGAAGSPTRLSAAAADAFAAVSTRAAAANDSDASASGGERTLMDSFEVCDEIIGVVSSWARVDERGSSGLFRECCDRARARLASLAASARDVEGGDDAAARALRVKSRLFNRAWSDWVPALLAVRSKNSDGDMVTALESAFGAASEMVNSDDAGAGDGVAHALITVGLHLGRIGIDHENRQVLSSMVSEETAATLDSMLQTYAGSALLPALRCSNETAQSVAAVLIRIVLAPEHLGWTEQSESLLGGVLPLVEEGDDVISAGFARLIADLVARDPRDESLTRILQICGGSSRSAKVSALRVLMEIMRQKGSNLSSETLATVTRAILPRLGDRDLESRKAAAEVFAHATPSNVFPVLVDLLLSKDSEERSAAGDAVVATLQQQPSPAAALDTYFATLLAPAMSSDVATFGEKISRAVKLLSRFAETVRANEWKSVIQTLTSSIFRSPSSSALHQAVAALTPWIGKPPASDYVVEACARQLSTQSIDKGVNEREVFDRLAPLLLLRVLPVAVWDESSENKDAIRKCMRRRMLNIRGEFEDVRRVCSEMFGRLPQNVLDEELFEDLRRLRETARSVSDDLARVRSCMFSCNSALALRGESALSERSRREVRSLSMDILTWVDNAQDDVELSKAHMGAMETLASLIVAEIEARKESPHQSAKKKTSSALLDTKPPLLALNESKASSGRALIVELDGDEDVTRERVDCARETLRGVLHLACHTKEGVPKWVDDALTKDLSLRLAMMNVIIAAARRPSIEKASLMDECFPPLIACVEHRGEPEVRAAALQALMMIFHGAERDVDETHAVTLVRTVTNILRDHAAGDGPRMGATKVATALLAADEDVLKAIEPHLEALRQGLETAARVAVDPEVAALATKLATCMTTPS